MAAEFAKVVLLVCRSGDIAKRTGESVRVLAKDPFFSWYGRLVWSEKSGGEHGESGTGDVLGRGGQWGRMPSLGDALEVAKAGERGLSARQRIRRGDGWCDYGGVMRLSGTT